MQGLYTSISTRTNSAYVPRHAPNGVIRPVTVQHDHARARAVSDRLGDLCRHERRFRPVSVQASSKGSAGGVAGRDLLIDLEKVNLHPALKEEWRFVSDFNVGIVEALKLKQPALVALFIARCLGEATASEKAGTIRTAHA